MSDQLPIGCFIRYPTTSGIGAGLLISDEQTSICLIIVNGNIFHQHTS